MRISVKQYGEKYIILYISYNMWARAYEKYHMISSPWDHEKLIMYATIYEDL